MRICDNCGKEFDYDEEESEFICEYGLYNFEYFKRCLCADCAGEVIESEDIGEYYEFCEKCGRKFDYFADNYAIYSFTDGERKLSDFEEILCEDCAFKEMERLEREDQ